MQSRFAGPLAAAWPGTFPLADPGSALPVPPATARDEWARLPEPTLAAVRARAQADLGQAWPQPLGHLYARYFGDGDRDTYEQLVFARTRRLSRAAILAAVTLDPLWIDELTDGVTLACEQSSWCWPAHDDTFRVHGAVVPTVTDPFLDLGAGEVAGQLAWIDHILGPVLDERVPGLRERARHEVDRRVLTPFETRRDWHWLGLSGDVHNWNPWIHGNVLVAALTLLPAGPRRTGIIELVIEGIDRYVASLPADGAIDEGYSYWWNGAGRTIEALSILAFATGGTLDWAGIPALRATVAFPHRCHLGGDWYLNHADGPARVPTHPSRTGTPWAALLRAATRVGDAASAAHAAAYLPPGEPIADEDAGLGRFLVATLAPVDAASAITTSALTTSAPAGASSPPATESWLARDVWFPSTQVLVARPAAGTAAGLTLAVKGGHNDEHHNHNDVGSVVVALNGVPVLVDAGRPTYTAQTFGPDRYAIWTMQSSWHNVPEIRGTAQSQGAAFAAHEVRATIGDDGTSLELDLAAAYPRTDLTGWHRVARLDRTPGVVTITDSWSLRGDSPAPTTVRYLVAGDIDLAPGRARITALAGAGTLVLSWDPVVAVSMVVRELDDPMLNAVWGDRLTRLDIDITRLGPAGTLTVTAQEQR